jgi:hypothetical protein
MNKNDFMNSSIIQVVQLLGYGRSEQILVFTKEGKYDCIRYFDAVVKALEKRDYIYYRDSNYKTAEPYTFSESFYKIEGNALVIAKNFGDCNFYERSFYTWSLWIWE